MGDVLPNKIHITKPSMESVYTKMEFYKHHLVFRQVRCIVTRNNFNQLNNLAIKKKCSALSTRLVTSDQAGCE